MPASNASGQPSASETTGESSSAKAPPPDFSELPPEKRDLAEKVSNVGV